MHHHARDEQLARSAAVRLRHHLAGAAVLLAAARVRNLLQRYQRKAGFRPDQPRDEIGRWTDASGNPVSGRDDLAEVGEANPNSAHLATGRGPVFVRIGGRIFEATTNQQVRLSRAEIGAEIAVSRTQSLDPSYRPRRDVFETVEGAIASAHGRRREAEERMWELLPRGFGSYESYVTFGQTMRDGLRAAGYRDVEPMIRGSAVAGLNFRTREPFDVGRRSDYDIALVSPTLMQRAMELGVPLRGGGSRTGPLGEQHINALGLGNVRARLEVGTGREVSLMIYRSRQSVTRRGPSRPILGN